MAYLYVKQSGTPYYSTIMDAVFDANEGDNIMIYPGTYLEQVVLTKHVNLRGLTDTPENGDIQIRYPVNGANQALRINYDATAASGTAGPEFIFECIDITCYHTSDNAQVFTVVAQSAGTDPSERASIIFNRSRIIQLNPNAAVQTRMMNFSNTYFNKVIFDHCELNVGPGNGNQFVNTYWSRMEEGAVLACVFNRSYSTYSSDGSPFPLNYVYPTTVSGYGPSYSNDFYIEREPVGYFDGYVFEDSSPVQRTVNLHRRDTGEIVNTTTSNPAGYYYMDTTLSGMHYVVALDAPADPLYNDLIIGSAYPTPI